LLLLRGNADHWKQKETRKVHLTARVLMGGREKQNDSDMAESRRWHQHVTFPISHNSIHYSFHQSQTLSVFYASLIYTTMHTPLPSSSHVLNSQVGGKLNCIMDQLRIQPSSTKVERRLVEKNRRNQMKFLFNKLNSLLPSYNPKVINLLYLVFLLTIFFIKILILWNLTTKYKIF